MRLRWLFLFLFALGLLTSIGFGFDGGPAAGGWLAAAALSVLGLLWTAWGEPNVGSRPAAESDTTAPPTLAAGAEPQPAPQAAPAPLAVEAPPIVHSEYLEYFERSPLPLVVIGRDGIITRMNHAAESVTEFAAAELRAQPYWDVFLTEAEAERAAADFREVMLTRRVPMRQETWRTRTGARAHFEWWRTLLKDEFGQPLSVLAAALPGPEPSAGVDYIALTDQLTAINGYSELLLMSLDSDDPVRGDIEAIHRAGLAARASLTARQTV